MCRKKKEKGVGLVLGSPLNRASCHGFRVVVAGVAGPMGVRQLVA